jgi:hypothetical protein
MLLVPAALMAQTPNTSYGQVGGGQVVGPSCQYTGSGDCRGTQSSWHYGQEALSSGGAPRDWWADRQAGGFAEVTKTQGRAGYGGYNTGSLELRLKGDDGIPGSNEWAFWYQFAGGASYENAMSAKFGTLGNLSSLSFDWFRNGDANGVNDWNKTSTSADWAYKTPVVRLRLLEKDANGNSFESELVWEGWYNKQAVGPDGTPVDTWVSQTDMRNGNFWYARPPSAGGSATVTSGEDCSLVNQAPWQGSIASYTIDALLDENCIAHDTWVTGVAVGIGNRWPHQYSAFVDNVHLGFGKDEGRYTAVNTNFDFVPVPEPASLSLLGAGAAALALAARRRRR